MVRRLGSALPLRVVLLGLVLSLGYIGCDKADPSALDLGVEQVDQGAFIPCALDKGTMTNPVCPSDRPMCHPLAQVCVGCIPSSQTCQPGYTCSEDFRCLPIDPNAPCRRNVDCPQRGVAGADPLAITCNLETGKCQECVANEDCVANDGGPGVCAEGHCIMND